MTVAKTKYERLGREPRVGIFWLVGKHLVLAGTPLARAESSGEFKNFLASHVDFWAELQRNGGVPREMEYEEPPRGRVVYNAMTQRFTLMADRCILRNKRLVGRIMRELGLPRNTELLADSHYRCATCASKATEQQKEEDWDF